MTPFFNFAGMKKLIAILFLLLFTTNFVVISYGVCAKDIQVSFSVVEDEETKETKLEVGGTKLFIRSFEHPFIVFEQYKLTSEHNTIYTAKIYEDVYLSSIETPPDFLI